MKYTVCYKDILELFNNEGYRVLTIEEEWKNRKLSTNYFQIEFICLKGHNYHMTYGNFYKGERCKLCATNAPVYWSNVVELFENKKGWKILSKEEDWHSAYKDKIEFQCSKGHIYSYTYTSLKNGNSNCPYCSNNVPILFKDIKKWFEDEGWTVLSTKKDYKSQNKTPIECICPNGHKQYKSVRKWRMGRRCPYCITSGPELKLRKLIDNMFIEYKANYRKLGVELDIYIPSLKKAIEFNGDYWHCNPSNFNKDYYHKHKGLFAYQIWERDKKKKLLCDKNGIQLLIIWEYDWINNHKQMKNIIKEFLI